MLHPKKRVKTKAETDAIKNMAKMMSDKDLDWQIANAGKLRIPADFNQLFKNELASRKNFQ